MKDLHKLLKISVYHAIIKELQKHCLEMTRMKQDSHIYLLLQYYSLFAIPVRLYENKQLIFQKIPFIDTEDPVQLVLPKIMNDNREIGYCFACAWTGQTENQRIRRFLRFIVLYRCKERTDYSSCNNRC